MSRINLRIIINPYQLRCMADRMEEQMASAYPDSRVWKETLDCDGAIVQFIADEGWFERLKAGIPNWEAMVPGPEALERFNVIRNEVRTWATTTDDPNVEVEKREFPDTYSGAAWRAAYRIWKEVAVNGREILADGNPLVDEAARGLGLSGFQFGWAVNAVRQMIGLKPGTNPAILVLGGEQPIVPATGSPESDMRDAIGGRHE